ncbi:MAG: hypothetical protein ABJA80_16855 [bacterium]
MTQLWWQCLDTEESMPVNPTRKSATTRTKQAGAPTTAQLLAGFIAKFDPAVARVIRDCRTALRRRLPSAVELVYDNYNFFVIGYGPTERPSDCLVSLTAAANGVGLSFIWGATLPDPLGLLQGNGKQNRFVRLPTAATLSTPGVSALIDAAIAQSRAPLTTLKGYTVVKSISAKQRPRRRV